jgi:perosamine synthetase
MKKKFISLPSNSSQEKIRKKLSSIIKLIPLVDKQKKLIDIASNFRFSLLPLYEPYLKGNEQKYVNDVINSGWISSKGKYVKKFENIFCKSIGAKNAMTVSSGTSAIQLALLTLGIGSGDEVIVPNFTFAAVYNAVIFSGAKPIMVDINKKTLCIDEQLIEKKITKKTKAIIPVHLYGCSSNMDKVLKIAKKNKMLVIEDCAEALGTYYKKKHVGLFGDAATFSFYGNKTISTGEGGMVIFKSKKNSLKGDIIKNHGMSKKIPYWHEQFGLNFRMTNLQASIGLAQMEQFQKILKKKFEYNFNPHLLPTFRGILSSIYLETKKNVSILKIHQELKRYYLKNVFIKILGINIPMGSGNVLHTNNCEISICKTRYKNKIVIFSAIDNLVKGASGQAIQNMNLLYGYKENLGLK